MGAVTYQTVTLRDGREVDLREGVPADVGAVLRFMAGMLPECRKTLVTTTEEFDLTTEQVAEHIRRRAEAGGVLLLAEHGHEVIGTASCEPGARGRLAHVATLGMSLRETWRGVGLGSAMMRWLIDWAERQPAIEKLSLGVFADNQRAIRLYRRFGFVEEGRLVRAVQREPGEYVDDLVMGMFLGASDRSTT